MEGERTPDLARRPTIHQTGRSKTMNGTLPRRGPTAPPALSPRRVRHEVRDGAVVVAFSAAASTTVALVFMLLVRLAG
jgi:hypothetical protein